MLAEAKSFTQVRRIADEMEHVKLYGRQVKDRRLIAEATDVQTRAERRLGELIAAAKERGWIREGRPGKSAETVEGQRQFRLDEAGIDRDLSSRAQRLAELPSEEFEQGVAAVRDRITSGGATLINGARAIMASRKEPDDSLDYFPTPPWATRALLEIVLAQLDGVDALSRQLVWEPACGEGHIAEVLLERFRAVMPTDIHDYGYGAHEFDFLGAHAAAADFLCEPVDWIITNPPFAEKTEDFVLRALDIARVGVAMFVRLQWLETTGRYEAVFRDHPPTLIAFFAERVNLCKGRWEPDGSTATAYIWLVWARDCQPRAPFWIPPGQRDALTRADDRERFTAHPVRSKHAVDRGPLWDVHGVPHKKQAEAKAA
jgi:methylase of polypeptide subunit release factors